jgi:hypothetical protein
MNNAANAALKLCRNIHLYMDAFMQTSLCSNEKISHCSNVPLFIKVDSSLGGY